jgi:hypothetical protein
MELVNKFFQSSKFNQVVKVVMEDNKSVFYKVIPSELKLVVEGYKVDMFYELVIDDVDKSNITKKTIGQFFKFFKEIELFDIIERQYIKDKNPNNDIDDFDSSGWIYDCEYNFWNFIHGNKIFFQNNINTLLLESEVNNYH